MCPTIYGPTLHVAGPTTGPASRPVLTRPAPPQVVNYQKQLQLNYMEMYKRNKSLELELNSRESKLNSSGESQC